MSRHRFALAMDLPDGTRWYAAQGASRTRPMRTADPDHAQRWESPGALQDWLDAIPDVVETKEGRTPGGRRWMTGLGLAAVELIVIPGRQVSLRGDCSLSAPLTGTESYS